jgi:hypothetical protein
LLLLQLLLQAEQDRRVGGSDVNEYDELLNWLDEADKMLQIVDKPVHNREQEYTV